MAYKLTLAETPALLVSLLTKFRVELVPGQVVTSVYGLVTSPADEIWITLDPRK